jgi:hypothetical protein
MANIYESELETELETGLHEDEMEFEDEAGMEGEGLLGGLLGEGEGEDEFEFEMEDEMEGEFESGEQFFGSVFKGIKGLVGRAAPFLKRIAKFAAPMVGTAIGGPFGGMLGKLASNALGEGEDEYELHEMEFEGEEEGEYEFEGESESEVAHEIMSHELTQHEALAEMMASSAAHAQHEGEAEAMIGAATITVLSPADRRALGKLLPRLVRGAAVLTRILRKNPKTKVGVLAVPNIIRRTVKHLKKRAAAGKPITRRAVAKTAAMQVRKVLGSPKVCAAAITRNVKSSRAMKRRRRVRSVRG